MVKMDWKAEKERMPILHHGTDSSGYSLVEALVAVFLAGILLLGVLSGIIVSTKYSNKITGTIDSLIEKNNQKCEEKFLQ